MTDFDSPRRSILLDVDNYHFFRFTSLFPTLHKHPEVAAFLPLDTWLHVSAQPRSSVNLTHWYYCRILLRNYLRNHSGFYFSTLTGNDCDSKMRHDNYSIRTFIRLIYLSSRLYYIAKYISYSCHIIRLSLFLSFSLQIENNLQSIHQI